MVVNFLWNQLKSTLLGAPVRVSLIGSFAVGRLLYYIWATPDGSLHQRKWQRAAFAFCPLALTLNGRFVNPVVKVSFAGIRTQPVRIPARAVGQLKHPASWTKQLPDAETFYQKTAILDYQTTACELLK